MRRVSRITLSIAAIGGYAHVAVGQTATRTWVSSSGLDTNTCARTAPCRTFSGALAKTAAGGEVDAIDEGSYGPIVINKSITIDGGGVATIEVAPNSTGVDVNASYTDYVILRNLDINGHGTGGYGITLTRGYQLVVENVHISGVAFGGIYAISLVGTVVGHAMISNSTISGTGSSGTTTGVWALAGNSITLSHSIVTATQRALAATSTSLINADSNVLSFNGTAVEVNGGTIRLSNNDVYNNLTGFHCEPGSVLASAGNNRKAANTGGGATTCAPNAIITQQ